MWFMYRNVVYVQKSSLCTEMSFMYRSVVYVQKWVRNFKVCTEGGGHLQGRVIYIL